MVHFHGHIVFVVLVFVFNTVECKTRRKGSLAPIAEDVANNLYMRYRAAFEDERHSYRRMYRRNNEYEIHVEKLKEVNGVKKHNLKIEVRNGKSEPIVYINNPVESKFPHPYLSLNEFKDALTKRVQKQKDVLTKLNIKTNKPNYALKNKPTRTRPSQRVNLKLSKHKKKNVTKTKVENIFEHLQNSLEMHNLSISANKSRTNHNNLKSKGSSRLKTKDMAHRIRHQSSNNKKSPKSNNKKRTAKNRKTSKKSRSQKSTSPDIEAQVDTTDAINVSISTLDIKHAEINLVTSSRNKERVENDKQVSETISTQNSGTKVTFANIELSTDVKLLNNSANDTSVSKNILSTDSTVNGKEINEHYTHLDATKSMYLEVSQKSTTDVTVTETTELREVKIKSEESTTTTKKSTKPTTTKRRTLGRPAVWMEG